MMQEQKLMVVTFSGLVFSGKTFYLQRILQSGRYERAVTISMDDVRVRLFGGKKCTRTEQIFKNETTRHEVKTLLITKQPPFIFLEMVMLTRRWHQEPMMEMVKNVQWYLNQVEAEKTTEERPMASVKVELKPVLLYCDCETVQRRTGYRLAARSSNATADVFDIVGFIENALEFEFPVAYKPLYINTSDESPQALERNEGEIHSFLTGSMPLNDVEMRTRVEQAERFLQEARALKGYNNGN